LANKEPRTKEVAVLGGKLYLTEQELKHPKSGEMKTYVSFSNGQDVSGVYIEQDTMKEIAEFFNKKKGAKK